MTYHCAVKKRIFLRLPKLSKTRTSRSRYGY